MNKLLISLFFFLCFFTNCKKENEKIIISTTQNNISGFYSEPFKLILSYDNNHKIYYTLDGSKPTIKSKVFKDYLLIEGSESYDSLSFITTSNYDWSPPANRKIIAQAAYYLFLMPIEVFNMTTRSDYNKLISSKFSRWLFPYKQDQATIVRYAGFKDDLKQTKTKTLSFFINKMGDIHKHILYNKKDTVVSTKYKMPIISLSTNKSSLFDHEKGLFVSGVHFNINKENSGNFFKKGKIFEREVFFQYFNTQGELNFECNIGMRIHGGVTRKYSQKSLRFYARNKYGKSAVNLPSISKNRVNRFILEGMKESGGGGALIEDIVAQELVKDIGLEQQNFHPVVVFINGEYWGLHTLRERIDENYLANKFNTHKDSFDIIDGKPPYYKIINGNNSDYIKLLDFIKENDLTDNENYNFISNRIDISNFINYYSVQLFFANLDWPIHNLKLWKKKNNGKWRFLLYDLDGGFSYANSEDTINDYKINMFDRVLNDQNLTSCIKKI